MEASDFFFLQILLIQRDVSDLDFSRATTTDSGNGEAARSFQNVGPGDDSRQSCVVLQISPAPRVQWQNTL